MMETEDRDGKKWIEEWLEPFIDGIVRREVKKAIANIYDGLQDFEDENARITITAQKLAEIVNEVETEALKEYQTYQDTA